MLDKVGLDEVGRGAWAGPVVVASARGDSKGVAEILSDGRGGFVDSKILGPQRRLSKLDQLTSTGVSFGVGFVPAKVVDGVGLVSALRQAALLALGETTPSIILLDGDSNYLGSRNVETIVKGDVRDPLIAAASIYAKVARDQLMVELDAELPYWDFASNKGYGTWRHRCGLAAMGPSPEHRLSFEPVRLSKVRSGTMPQVGRVVE